MITVKDIYELCKSENIPMLSDYASADSDFWESYRTNYRDYDRVFYRTYRSFCPYMQDLPRTIFDKPNPAYIKQVQEDFIFDVKNFLTTNHKRYVELFRTTNIADTDYSLTGNYSMEETLTKEGSVNTTSTDGSRSDTDELTRAERIDNDENTIGARADTTSAVLGDQTSTSTQKVAPYDSELYNEDTQISDVIGGKTDENTYNQGEQIDTRKFTKGAETETRAIQKGEQINKSDATQNENYTMTSKGTNGSKSPTEILEQHDEFWKKYEFYSLIFSDIANSILVVGQ